jgi:shikimate dehydrogenase
LNVIKKLSFGLIGFPLGHSISPQIHARLFELSGVNAQYSLFEIEPEKFELQTAFLRSLDGFNITIPHKRRILPMLDQIDLRAQRCCAVNTVKCVNGEFHGFNTDADGFLRALDGGGIELRGRVLLCGAGGAVLMMACEALERGCRLVIATRDGQGARIAQSDLMRIFPDADISAQALSEVDGCFDIILNATPAGMYPNIDGCPVSQHIIQNSAAVFDAIYNPCETVLVRAARAAGANAVGGLTMLIWQAVAAQKIWTGACFDMGGIETLREDMERLISLRYGNEPGGKL